MSVSMYEIERVRQFLDAAAQAEPERRWTSFELFRAISPAIKPKHVGDALAQLVREGAVESREIAKGQAAYRSAIAGQHAQMRQQTQEASQS